jgi:hypothetical protein
MKPSKAMLEATAFHAAFAHREEPCPLSEEAFSTKAHDSFGMKDRFADCASNRAF